MHIKELIKMIKDNGEPIAVQFTDKIDDGENYQNEKMKAYLTSISYVGAGCYRLDFSMNEFLEFNKTVAKSDFYDDNHNPCLTWFDKCYPENGKVSTYIDEDYDIDIFTIINEKSKVLLNYYSAITYECFKFFDTEYDAKAFCEKFKETVFVINAYKVFDKHEIKLL